MNREEIINMAREAGFPEAILELSPTALERFAEMIACAERKEWENEFAGMGEWSCVHIMQERYS